MTDVAMDGEAGRGRAAGRPTAKTLRFHSASAADTVEIGQRIGADLAATSPAGAVVLLVGPLGAGKTVLAKGIARGIGIAEQITSPTYTIVSEYPASVAPLYHVDLYRIEGRDQLENLGLDDILRGNGIVLVEWGEKLDQSLARARMRVTLELAADGGRDILVEDDGA